MRALLNKPYPYLHSFKRNILGAVLIGLFVVVVSTLLIDGQVLKGYMGISRTTLGLLYGFNTFLGTLLVLEWFPKVGITEKNKDEWTIGKESLLIFFLLTVITLLNYGVSFLFSSKPSVLLSVNYIAKIFFWVIVVGSAPTFSIAIWVNYKMFLKKNLLEVKAYNEKLNEIIRKELEMEEKKMTVEEKVTLFSTGETNNILTVSVHTILFIQAEENCIEVYLMEGDKPVKKQLCQSLNEIEEQLASYQFIVKTHNSFLVNIRRISFTEGNARNYRLFFEGITHSVPVSRSKFKAFRAIFQEEMANSSEEAEV
ncbi:LytTR family transcriptional regulator [Aquimarina sp. TRL1]|uniref:LytR/AlgR family response regulator transcription factor n=1 Tax=Aquimarina sp. (strain TRL1) TaxID=2736252 RepID=UPI001588A799|nr:LytTR family DNA-binding domain-containing protein [Aquimarina sp. TRL1]QKX04914.1 LytTR family transcriptional regulator [Aquimarina sp. TRL1]